MKRNRTAVIFLFCFLTKLTVLAQENQISKDTTGTLNESEPRAQMIDTIQVKKNTSPTFSKDTLYLEGLSTSSDTSINKGLPSEGTSSAPSIMATLDAGRMEGTLDVSATGGAVFSIPFILPPGIGDVVPQVGLAYNSQGGVGTAGFGWNVSGLSSISRVAAVKYIDDRVGGVNFNNNDRFSLDGQRLLLKSGVYGGDGAEYQTEQYSNLMIISRGVSPYGAGYGPAYFEVHYPDGSKAFYGQTSNSRSPTSYAITYTENPLGARISYQYLLNNNILYISSIGYGSKGVATAINRINFNYSTATRAEQAYVGGTAFYQGQILTKVSVVANGTNFRHYVPTYGTISPLNYQRMSSIQEFDGTESKSLVPIYFSYGSTGNIITSHTISNLSLTGIASNNSRILTADYTGDGTMDFLLYPTAKNKFWAFYDLEPGSPHMQLGYEVNTGPFREIFPANWLSHNNKILAGQGMMLVKDNGYNKFKFEAYSSGTVTPVYYQYEKLWDNVPLSKGYYSECDNQYHEGIRLTYEFISGDFKGNGLTDIIAINVNQSIITFEQGLDPYDPYYCEQFRGDSYSYAYYINMDRRVSTNYISYGSFFYPHFEFGEKLYTGDFNGDGKTDVLHVKSGSMHVYSHEGESLSKIWSTTDSRITNNVNNPILIGDYNGDGKMDVMFATGYNNVFASFISTGTSFVKHEKTQPFSNVASSWNGTTLNQYYLIPTDINGDGKTDIIFSKTTTINSSANGTINVNIHHNTGVTTTNQPIFSTAYSSSKYTNLRHYPIPIFLNPNKPNLMLEFGFISDNSISLFQSKKDVKTESQLTSVNHNIVTHTIDYGKLTEGSYSEGVPTYQSSYEQTYPYVDIFNAPAFSVVRKISRHSVGSQQAMQVFGYAKAVSHYEGMGFLGFGETIRSNWYANSSDINRTFIIGIQNPQLRGANMRTFTSKSTYINSTIKNMSLSNPPPAGGIADGATLSDYISRQDNAYSTQTLANRVFINTLVATASKNMLNGTFGTQTIQYDAYYNPTTVTENINGVGTNTVENTYANSVGSSYYIGRLLTSLKAMNNGSDIYSTTKEYTYTGYLPTILKQKGHGTDYITESRLYDTYGNIAKRTISVPGLTDRVQSMEYDVSGRFLTKNTDVDNLITLYAYNSSTGTLQSRTNPYNQTDNYQYDSWGRQTGTTDFLGNTSNRMYSQLGYNLEITESDNEGRYQKTIINPWGQTIEVQEKTILGQMVGKAWQYDIYGRQTAESETAQLGSYSQWNTITYDLYGRTSQTSAYTGKVTNYSYSGLSTTANDGTKTVTTTKNAFDLVTALQDPGGSVNYTHFANGNLKTADYNGIVQTIEQDGWGRKTKLTDPSAGIYEYEYDGFDQLKKEATPKGIKQYVYDDAGKLTQKTITGDNTNMQYVYSYDATTKLLTDVSLNNTDGNNTTYTYTYDTQKRLESMIEDNLHAQFKKTYTYDNYGHVSTQKQEAKDKSSNITVAKTVAMQYQNGQLLQTTLQGTGEVLWKVDALNTNGMLSSSLQGSSLKNTFTYDAYNLPQQSKLDRTSGTPTNLMTLGYAFNAQRGLLDSRSNSAFSWNETFAYDSFDRLTSFNDNNGSNSQGYDGRGRITNNSQLGLYSYGSNSYQQNELELNSAADAYYQARSLLEVSYNSFKSPVEIVEPGHDRISFQYNAALSRSHMYYGGEQVDKMQRRYRKHYAEDGGVEITKDMQTGTTSFIFYLDGDAYSAPAIWKEVRGSSPVAENLYYLHRDHLGSIVMITDPLGTVVEKRAFDAWGNIVKLTDGNNNILSNFVILDRGFTGHEHLTGVVLIHMNARLYDPKIHRFLAPDNYVQDPFSTQNFNRYGYALNNPLVYVDQAGEFIFSLLAAIFAPPLLPWAIGADIGMWSGGSIANKTINPFKWDYSSAKTWGYMAGGAAAGALAGGVGNIVATSGMPFANTAALASGSLINSFGTYMYTGGETDVMLSLGIASYNFSSGTFGYLGKKGNSFMENMSYGLGALANLSDAFAGFDTKDVQLNTEKSDLIGHSSLTKVGEFDSHNSFVSVGPDPGGKWIYNPFKFRKGTNQWDNYVNAGDDVSNVIVKGVNLKTIAKYGANLDKGVKYNLYCSSCVNHTARALTISGAPAIGIHPFLLNAQMYMRSIGARPSLLSYHLLYNRKK